MKKLVLILTAIILLINFSSLCVVEAHDGFISNEIVFSRAVPPCPLCGNAGVYFRGCTGTAANQYSDYYYCPSHSFCLCYDEYYYTKAYCANCGEYLGPSNYRHGHTRVHYEPYPSETICPF